MEPTRRARMVSQIRWAACALGGKRRCWAACAPGGKRRCWAAWAPGGKRRIGAGILLVILAHSLFLAVGRLGAAENALVESRLLGDVEYLASDRLEGRGIGTAGIAEAAGYLRNRFRELGLASGTADGSYFQPFSVQIGSKIDPDGTHLALAGPEGKKPPLVRGEEYQPLAFGGTGRFDAPIVFAGYGITAPKQKYDDYAGLDVAGKVVLVLRREPQQGDPKSVFAPERRPHGDPVTQHSALFTKIRNALDHKAAAMLVVTDPATTKREAKDPLLPSDYVPNRPLGLPVAHVTQEVANQLLQGSGLGSLAEMEAAIDGDLVPRSRLLEGWKSEGRFTFDPITAEARNVIAVLRGEGPLAQESIVIGAHYDHLGYGEAGSLAPGQRAIHNGADDNASGAAALLDLARRFTERNGRPAGSPRRGPPARTLVFIAFSGEERGLLGSGHYVRKEPVVSLDSTIAMINFDMVGRMKESTLQLMGTKTAKEFEPLLTQASAERDLKLKMIGLGSRNSDHAEFYRAKIPVLHFFTGTHSDYHKPSDDTDKINAAGIRQVADFAEAVIDALLAMPQRPAYVEVKDSNPHPDGPVPAGGEMAYLGTVPDYGEEVQGVLLNDVTADSPAQKGGLKPGDIIVDIAGTPIQSVEGYALALRRHRPGQTVAITVLRGKEEKKKVVLSVTLGARNPGPMGK